MSATSVLSLPPLTGDVGLCAHGRKQTDVAMGDGFTCETNCNIITSGLWGKREYSKRRGLYQSRSCSLHDGGNKTWEYLRKNK